MSLQRFKKQAGTYTFLRPPAFGSGDVGFSDRPLTWERSIRYYRMQMMLTSWTNAYATKRQAFLMTSSEI